MFSNMLKGLADLLSNYVTTACIWVFWDEPTADQDIL